jgi:undecaprenyl diphosphate synthase
MDGNNRWAKLHGYTSREGHRRGAEAARDIVNYCLKSEISILTLFAFSSENWLRPKKRSKSVNGTFHRSSPSERDSRIP